MLAHGHRYNQLISILRFSSPHPRINECIHPIILIPATPASKPPSASACLPTMGLRHNCGSITKSAASISTHDAYMSMPAEMADIRPCVNFI